MMVVLLYSSLPRSLPPQLLTSQLLRQSTSFTSWPLFLLWKKVNLFTGNIAQCTLEHMWTVHMLTHSEETLHSAHTTGTRTQYIRHTYNMWTTHILIHSQETLHSAHTNGTSMWTTHMLIHSEELHSAHWGKNTVYTYNMWSTHMLIHSEETLHSAHTTRTSMWTTHMF